MNFIVCYQTIRIGEGFMTKTMDRIQKEEFKEEFKKRVKDQAKMLYRKT